MDQRTLPIIANYLTVDWTRHSLASGSDNVLDEMAHFQVAIAANRLLKCFGGQWFRVHIFLSTSSQNLKVFFCDTSRRSK